MKNIAIVLSIVLFTGCTRLNSYQVLEYKDMDMSGELVIEDDPTAAAFLGILPGGGSFYTGNIGIGIVNLLLWPYSILWDPINGFLVF